MTYVVAIPSYNRSLIISKKTLKTLKDGNINHNNIYIFVANKDEYDNYKKEIPKELYGKIIVGNLGITNQRIFIKNYFKEGENIVSIDDDIEGLYKMKGMSALSKINNLDSFFKLAFERLKNEKLFIWGIYPVRNPYFMQNNITTKLKFIIGALYGFINRKTKDLEPKLNLESKGDYELSILYYKKDGGVLRYNNITVKTKFLAKGGLGEIEQRFGKNKKSAEYLQKTYPDIVTIFHRKNGMTEIRLSRNTDNKTKKNIIHNHTKTKKNK